MIIRDIRILASKSILYNSEVYKSTLLLEGGSVGCKNIQYKLIDFCISYESKSSMEYPFMLCINNGSEFSLLKCESTKKFMEFLVIRLPDLAPTDVANMKYCILNGPIVLFFYSRYLYVCAPNYCVKFNLKLRETECLLSCYTKRVAFDRDFYLFSKCDTEFILRTLRIDKNQDETQVFIQGLSSLLPVPPYDLMMGTPIWHPQFELQSANFIFQTKQDLIMYTEGAVKWTIPFSNLLLELNYCCWCDELVCVSSHASWFHIIDGVMAKGPNILIIEYKDIECGSVDFASSTISLNRKLSDLIESTNLLTETVDESGPAHAMLMKANQIVQSKLQVLGADLNVSKTLLIGLQKDLEKRTSLLHCFSNTVLKGLNPNCDYDANVCLIIQECECGFVDSFRLYVNVKVQNVSK